jgi:hypothetical protein
MTAITAKTPAGAAKQLYKELCTIAVGIGQDPSEIAINRPADAMFGGWEVVWECGPYEWAVVASLGGDIFEEELQGTLYRNTPTFKGLVATKGKRWFAEPGYSFSLGFYPA